MSASPLDSPVEAMMAATKAVMIAAVASCVALGYSEILFCGTRSLYLNGKLLRYYPLPKERHLFTAGLSAFGFIAPTALFATFSQADMQRSWDFNLLSILLYTGLYLLIHDVYFFQLHWTFHRLRPLYNYFHAMHHEYVYAMNVYMVGYAEVAENMLQVGVPWITWTYIAGSNWWNWLLPLSLIVFTTLVGHSGYRMALPIAIFHPLVLPFTLLTGKFMLTPGDHQVHHSHRRYNFGLFWKVMDQWYGTYRKCETRAYDVAFWTRWAQAKEENSENSKKWMGRHAVQFEEVSWGF